MWGVGVGERNKRGNLHWDFTLLCTCAYIGGSLQTFPTLAKFFFFNFHA